MKPTEQNCNLQRIDDYLDERLSDALVSEFERHLCDCETCRLELQKRSAEADYWRDAVALLGPDLMPSDAFHSGPRRRGNDGPGSSEQTTEEPRASRRERYVLSVLDSLAQTDDPEMLGRVGDYEISGIVGVGGMGAVLKGFDKSLRRVVAIKIMAPHLAHSGSARTRFQREARAAAAITHDNVIDIYAVSEAAGLPYLVMPYARGPSLQKRIDEGGPLGVVELVRIGRQIAAGLSAAHEQGLVHRDIKPANILLSDGIERLWITDFGVARAMDDASMTQTGVIAGTPQYMSPEQARGESVDHRSDLFSLGSVLYTACTGRPPFRSEAAYGILRRITDTDPRPIREVNSEIPEWLCLIIARLLAKHPADRFESAGEVVELLDGCLAHLQQPLQVELPPSLRSKPAVDGRRSPVAIENNRSGQERQPSQLSQPTQQPRQPFPKRGLIMIGSILLTGLLGVLTMQWTQPTDISGHWTGENWKHVSLSSVDEASDWYSGTFVDGTGRRGALRLEWSRMQGRYNGRWKVGEAESGQITLRAGENGTLRGAVSVDPESQLEPDVPRLLEFAWQPASKEAQQEFESQTAKSQSKTQVTGRSTAGRSVSVQSPIQGAIVRIADGIQLNSLVLKGSVIAEIRPKESVSMAEQQQQLAALKRKSETARAKLTATQEGFDAAVEIRVAIEAQVKTLEMERHAVPVKSGAEQSEKRLLAQTNWDAAIVALKKAQADVVKAESERSIASVEYENLMREIADFEAKLQEVRHRYIHSPVDGKITYIATSGEFAVVNVGDVICEVTPDSAEPSASPQKAMNPVAAASPTPATAPAQTTTTAPVSEPRQSSPIQSFSAFGPASGLASRLRESREKLARILGSIEVSNTELTKLQEAIDRLREQQKQAREAGLPQGVILEQNIVVTEEQKRSKEENIKSLNAEKKIVGAALAEAWHEHKTIVKILQTQYSAARRQLDLKKESYERVKRNYQNGLSSLEELSQAQQAVAVVESESRQLELLLDFYSNMDKNDADQESKQQ